MPYGSRRNTNVLASSALGAVAGVAIVGLIIVVMALPASAQSANPASGYSGDFERPWGYSAGQETTAYDPVSGYGRDANGNRVILDGRIMSGADLSTLSSSSSSASASASASASSSSYAWGTAIGNQVNVITQGNYNTVVVNTTQINNGNQTAVLNGGLNLND